MVHCVRGPDGPAVSEVIALEDLAGGLDAAQFTVTPLFVAPRAGQPLAWSGSVPVRAGRHLEAAGYDVRALLGVGPASEEHW